jgi:hypothetical protein
MIQLPILGKENDRNPTSSVIFIFHIEIEMNLSRILNSNLILNIENISLFSIPQMIENFVENETKKQQGKKEKLIILKYLYYEKFFLLDKWQNYLLLHFIKIYDQ